MSQDASSSSLAIPVPTAILEAICDQVATEVATRLDRSNRNAGEGWLDVDAAASYLACTRKRIYDLVQQGRLRPARDGRRLLFQREWLDESLDYHGHRGL